MRDNSLSPADVALITGNNRDNAGFGDGTGAWWIIIFLIFAFTGWGRNGNGLFGGNGNGASDNYILASDFATIQRQLSDGFGDLTSQVRYVQNGLCDGLYAQAQLINGVNQNIANGVYTLNTSVTNSGYETRNAIQGLSSQVADCCCKTQNAIQGVNYNLAMNTNQLQNTMCMNTRDIVDSINSNYRALHDELIANRIEDKNAQIASQQNEINALRLAASQNAQNNYLVNQLKPQPVPSYPVVNPNCCLNYQVTNGCCTGTTII